MQHALGPLACNPAHPAFNPSLQPYASILQPHASPGEEHVLDILAINEFTSSRKRMSVLVRPQGGGPCTLLLKGADDVVFDKLGAACNPMHPACNPTPPPCDPTHPPCNRVHPACNPMCAGKVTTEQRQRGSVHTIVDEGARHVDHFASQGLRTLVLAKRTLTEVEAEAWLAQFNDAATALTNREARLAEAAEAVEEHLSLIGVSAVEDLLQEGVPEAVSQLQAANIKIWMLTGDKQETAINIGYASKLLTSRMQLLTISGISLEHTRKVISARYSEVQSWRQQPGAAGAAKRAKRPLAIVIDGAALTFCDQEIGLRRLLLSMVYDCTRTLVLTLTLALTLVLALTLTLALALTLPLPLTRSPTVRRWSPAASLPFRRPT